MSSFTGIKFDRADLWDVVGVVREMYRENAFVYKEMRELDKNFDPDDEDSLSPHKFALMETDEFMLPDHDDVAVWLQVFDLNEQTMVGRIRERTWLFHNKIEDFLKENDHEDLLDVMYSQDTVVDAEDYNAHEDVIDVVDDKIHDQEYMLVPIVDKTMLMGYARELAKQNEKATKASNSQKQGVNLDMENNDSDSSFEKY